MEPQVQNGPDLEEIQTEAVGFQAVAGEAKLRLIPSPWPSNSLPPPTASLLSVASSKGLAAAAGPDSVIIANTESVRQGFSANSDGKIKPFTPQLTLPLGMRVSQVAFSADENFLVLSAENGGGLAVYDTQSLMQGNSQTAFEIPTNGAALRALVPNPAPEKGELFAAVSTNGDLLIADLKTRQILTGAQGQILKNGVSCISWSNKGKQLIAGLGDGSLSQMTPEGKSTGNIPKPANIEGDQFVSSISWLENDIFLVAYTPATSGDDMAPTISYHLVTRHNPKDGPLSIMYQKLPEPVAPFGLNRSPSSQFMQRLRHFPPNLDDTILVASTTSGDIGLVTKSKVPLSDDAPSERTSHVFTTTTMAEDSRRAQMPLPLDEEMTDTSPIGVALDLSSKDRVERPLPKEEFDYSQGPLPALLILNNEGILSMWWFVYADSIRQGTTYPGLVVAGGVQSQQPCMQASAFSNVASQAPSSFSQNAFGNSSTPSASPFGATFGKPSMLGSATPAFGAPSALGKPSPLGGGLTSGPVFGQSGFGTSQVPIAGSRTQGTTFGVADGLGNRTSPWGTTSAGSAQTSGSVFGQLGFSASKPVPFGSSASNNTSAPASGAFASFASISSPFITAAPTGGSSNPFGKPSTSAPFRSGMETDTNFGVPVRTNNDQPKSTFGSEGFTLGSTFKKDESSAAVMPKRAENTGGSMFSSDFSNALSTAQKQPTTTQTKDIDMDGDDGALADDSQSTPAGVPSTTPIATPAPFKSLFPQSSVPPKAGGLFGTQSQSNTTPAAVGNSQPTGFTIGNVSKLTLSTTMPNDSHSKPEQPQPPAESSPKIKEEPHSDDGGNISPLNRHDAAPPLGYQTPEGPWTSKTSKTSEVPLPPESTSKASFAPGDSSNSSKSSDEAPLPPDFLPSKTKLKQVDPAPHEEAALPSGDEDGGSELSSDRGSYEEEAEGSDGESGNLDEEGSGVDVAQEISPTTDHSQSPKITPGSSFGARQEKIPQGGLFGRVTAPVDRSNAKPSLFGEVGKTTAPYLPPPNKTQESPRSPSPVRSKRLGDSLRPDTARSISAPGPFQALNNRKATLSRTAVPPQPQPSPEDIRKQVKEQVAAEKARLRKDEEQDLSDHEDERIREELAAEVESTLNLDEFLAHQDYVGNDVKDGIPGQIEKVYRDINSMIDTLGINARSLKAFTKGHQERHKLNGPRTRDDLEQNDWCLIEIGDLPQIEDDLSAKLENSGTATSQEKISECKRTQTEIATLRGKCVDTKKSLDTHSDPTNVDSARAASLSLDQSTKQHELRKKMTKFQRLLAEAEENITMLRTKLASSETSNGNGPSLKKPTVEAITNTIMKMTAIVENKNRNLATLESQMQNLRFSSLASVSSREGSPFAIDSPRRNPASKLGASINGHHQHSGRSSILGHSVNGEATPRKGINNATLDEAQQYREKLRRRKEVNQIIRAKFEESGPRMVPLG